MWRECWDVRFRRVQQGWEHMFDLTVACDRYDRQVTRGPANLGEGLPPPSGYNRLHLCHGKLICGCSMTPCSAAGAWSCL